MTWEEIKEWLRDHVPWFLQWTLDGLFALVDAVHDAWNFLSGTLWDAYVGWVSGTADAWQGWLSGTVNAWTNWLSARLSAFNTWLVSRLNDWGNWLADKLNRFNTWLVDRLNSWSNWLVERLNSWGNWLADKLNRFNTWLVDRLNSWSNWLADRLNSWSNWLADKLNRFSTWLADRLNSWGNWLVDRLNGFSAWLADRLNDWGAWLEDRHEELETYLFGEEGFVTGAINELKEWVKGLFTQFAKEIILHLLDWMSYIAPPIEAIDEMGPHFSSFPDMLEEWAKAWKERKEAWVKEAMAMMEAFAAELRGEKEMDLLTPSETIMQYWQMLTPEQIRLIVEPPIKG